MKHIIRIIFLGTVCFSFSANAIDLFGNSFLSPRSQSLNAARRLVGIKDKIHLWNKKWHGVLSVTPSYGHSFRPYRIAEYFFGRECLTVSGSQVGNRQPHELLADHFGLSPAFSSDVQLRPQIRNALIDFSGYVGYKNFYAHLHLPVVWTRTEIELCETIHNNGADVPFPEFYFAQAAISAPVNSFTEAIKNGATVGDLSEKLKFGKMGCAQTERNTAEFTGIVGWNFINRRRGHVGFNLRFAVPAGNRPNSVYLLEPIVGNGHHTELGAGFSGHIIVWEKDAEQKLGLYTELNATHLFGSSQCRSFDFCQQGFGSRYMLLKEFNANNTYTGKLLPAINVTTLPCTVHNAIQFEFLFMAGYQYNHWGVDFGYSAWLRSKDVIKLKCECIDFGRYGFKGVQNVRTEVPDFDNITQSNATIVGTETPVVDTPSPHIITLSDLNLKSAANPKTFTHKLFSHIGYTWVDCFAQPFIEIGGEVEFESTRRREFTQPNKNSVSQWAIWAKGGVSF